MKLLCLALALCLSGCAAIPYKVGITYGGMMASYDGKSVRLDIDGNEVGRSLSGYSK
jgi:uncharacterized protein YceK